MMSPVYIRSACAVGPSFGPEPDYREAIKDAGLRRRMGRIVRMSVACALKCLEDIRPDAIITATALGCLADTEKFMGDLLERGEQGLNPTPFIYSVFNTPGAQTALAEGIRSYNTTYVHRGDSFSSALADALLCLSEGMDNVLVEAFDEVISASEDILRRLGRYRECREGAVSFLLSRNPSPGCTAVSEVKFTGRTAGHPYESMDAAASLYEAVVSGDAPRMVPLPLFDICIGRS